MTKHRVEFEEFFKKFFKDFLGYSKKSITSFLRNLW